MATLGLQCLTTASKAFDLSSKQQKWSNLILRVAAGNITSVTGSLGFRVQPVALNKWCLPFVEFDENSSREIGMLVQIMPYLRATTHLEMVWNLPDRWWLAGDHVCAKIAYRALVRHYIRIYLWPNWYIHRLEKWLKLILVESFTFSILSKCHE